MSAVSVPLVTLETFLTARGFSRSSVGNEIVFERVHHACQHVIIRVYTSVEVGETVSRGIGKDAIRASAFYRPPVGGQSRGVGKATRINRTGTIEGVLARLEERMREVYRAANHFVLDRRNSVCGCRYHLHTEGASS